MYVLRGCVKLKIWSKKIMRVERILEARECFYLQKETEE